MKNKAVFIAAAMLAAVATAPISLAKLVEGKISGTLSDSMCKTSHAEMIKMGHGKDAVSCTNACLKEGSKLILIDSKTKAIYSLQNDRPARKFAGKKVVISGHIDSAAKVVHVHTAKAG
jgi:phosphoenolpyruvate-protein kinase (PTS system EI component)